jgi:hypothetical protein
VDYANPEEYQAAEHALWRELDPGWWQRVLKQRELCREMYVSYEQQGRPRAMRWGLLRESARRHQLEGWPGDFE